MRERGAREVVGLREFSFVEGALAHADELSIVVVVGGVAEIDLMFAEALVEHSHPPLSAAELHKCLSSDHPVVEGTRREGPNFERAVAIRSIEERRGELEGAPRVGGDGGLCSRERVGGGGWGGAWLVVGSGGRGRGVGRGRGRLR